MKKHHLLFFFGLLLSFQSIYIKAQNCPRLKSESGEEDKVLINCSNSANSCVNLVADFPVLKGTEVYQVQSRSFSQSKALDDGTSIGMYQNETKVKDAYVKKISFSDASIFGAHPFKFSYFGKVYSSFLISSNGFITFNDLLEVGDFSSPYISGAQIPSQYLPKLSIFGVFQSLEFDKGVGDIKVKVEGVAPCRKLIISFYKGKIAETNHLVSSQIILNELSSDVEVYVENRPIITGRAKSKDAVIGLTDDANSGIAAPRRNTGNWAATKDGWLFRGAGEEMKKTIFWFEDGQHLNSGAYNNRTTVKVCPQNLSQKYKAKAQYETKFGFVLETDKSIEVGFDSYYPFSKNYVEVFCGASRTLYQSEYNAKITPNPVANFNFKYYPTEEKARNGDADYLNPAQPITANEVYYVRVENKNNPSCFSVASLKVGDAQAAQKTNTVRVCEDDKKGFKLSKLLCQLLDSGLEYQSPRFFINSPNSEEVREADLENNTKIYLKVTIPSCGEVTYGPISVNFSPGPPIEDIPQPILINLCDIVTQGNPTLKETNFNWVQFFEDSNIVITQEPDVNITVHATEKEAKNNQNPMSYILEKKGNGDYTYDVWVRVQPMVTTASTDDCDAPCFSIVQLSIKVIFDKIIINVEDADEDRAPDDPEVFDDESADIYLCKTDQATRTVDISADADQVIKLITTGNNIKRTFHESYRDADNLDQVGISDQQTIPANQNKTYYIRYKIDDGTLTSPDDPGCYVVVPLNYNIIDFPIKAAGTIFPICSSTQNETVQLKDYDRAILGNMWRELPQPTILYYDNAAASGAPIDNLTLTEYNQPKSVWTVVTSGYNPSCQSEPTEYQFRMVQNPVLDQNQQSILIECDNNNDGVTRFNLTDLNDGFVSNSSQYEIKYYRSYDRNTNRLSGEISAEQAQNFEIDASGEQSIYYSFSLPGTPCFSVAQADFKVNITKRPIVLKAHKGLIKCTGYTYEVKFNLEKIIPKVYDDSNLDYDTFITNVTFYETEADANQGLNAISGYQNYTLNTSDVKKIFWVRFESTEGCYSVVSFIIKVVNATDLKFSNEEMEVHLCEYQFSGAFKIDLRAWLDQQIENSEEGNSFLNDYEATLSAEYNFYLENPVANAMAVALTLDEEHHFQPDAQHYPYIYIKARADDEDCFQIAKITFSFADTAFIEIQSPEICREDTIDLTFVKQDSRINPNSELTFYRNQEDLIQDKNAIETPESYQYEEGIDEIIVKIIDSNAPCPQKAKIKLRLKPAPEFSIEPEFFICPTAPGIEVAPDLSQTAAVGLTPELLIWELPDGSQVIKNYPETQLKITEVGQYQLTVKANNGCQVSKSFIVTPYDIPTIDRLMVDGNTVTVVVDTPEPDKTLLYTYEGLGEWQESPVFHQVPYGVATFYARNDGIDCNSLPYATLVLHKTNVITPNGDGKNDIWTLDNLQVFGGQKVQLIIIDRYNRTVFNQSSNESIVWNGYFEGRVLPESTYWYQLTLPDGRVLSGWILLRNK
ncbi:T9SS type B sorting domain-containing protein [Riemerella columbina]|uniref:T9SS type B sorting domain-containing protein n=1 Tax=Riemerella columbina TaxID=103810 RepID=UPI0026709366|nr:T9SS type B sorting domain-containing protein [Riemerella columbina]WKS95476.1 T9SS type B sorting domain-containing protein [Riemerella columbina]